MPSVLQDNPVSYSYSHSHIYKGDLERKRQERLDLIWRIANRVWSDYKKRPHGCSQRIWDAITPRFTMTDLQTPVVRTIAAASHGGKVTRRLHSCVNMKEVEEFISSPFYDNFIKTSWNVEAVQYGMSYAVVGFKGTKMHLTTLPVVTTQVVTPDDDYEEILAVVADYPSMTKSYEADGVYQGSNGRDMKLLPDSNFGFVPVSIARGDKADCASPYSVDLVWPATQETVQVTHLMNDAMVLIRLQSFSTLVIKGNEASSPKDQTGHSPFVVVRLQGGTENDAKYITPDAAVDQIDDLIASKFERAAVQCRVPVDIFTKPKAGANQSAGSSFLQHKPLYDLVLAIQEQRATEERDLIARIDAAFSWLKNGKNPVDLEAHKAKLDIDIAYERDTNPSFNMADAQTIEMLLTSRLITHADGYYKIKPDGDDAEQKALEALRESDRAVVMPVGGIKEDSVEAEEE